MGVLGQKRVYGCKNVWASSLHVKLVRKLKDLQHRDVSSCLRASVQPTDVYTVFLTKAKCHSWKHPHLQRYAFLKKAGFARLTVINQSVKHIWTISLLWDFIEHNTFYKHNTFSFWKHLSEKFGSRKNIFRFSLEVLSIADIKCPKSIETFFKVGATVCVWTDEIKVVIKDKTRSAQEGKLYQLLVSPYLGATVFFPGVNN